MTTVLTQPFINSVSSFDVTIGVTIPLSILGGGKINGYKFDILNTSNVILYTKEYNNIADIDTLDIRNFPMEIEPNLSVLQNNNSYYIKAETFFRTSDTEIMVSQVSTQQLFSCYTTPKFNVFYYPDLVSKTEFKPISPSQDIIVKSDIIYMLLEFDNNDINSPAVLDRANINLYGVTSSGQKNLVFLGKDLYNNPLQESINGLTLTNSSTSIYVSYIVTVTGKTVDGMVFTQEFSNILCEYSQIQGSSFLKVTNICDEGYIKIESKLNDYEGTSNPVPPIYIGDNGIDLTEPTHWVKWQDYFNLDEQYTNRWWGSNFSNNATVIKLLTANVDKHADVKYVDDGTSTYLTLTSYSQGMFPYYIESDKIDSASISPTTPLFIGIQYKLGSWELSLQLM